MQQPSQHPLVGGDDEFHPKIIECMIVSNCARLEIYLVTAIQEGKEHRTQNKIKDEQQVLLQQWITTHVSSCIWAQCQAHDNRQKKRHALWENLLLPHDAPQRIINDLTIPKNDDTTTKTNNNTPLLRWTYLHKPTDICRHLCLIAAGLATRPNRPHRTVIFRPFSSRDAHILLQFKRTLETISFSSVLDPNDTTATTTTTTTTTATRKNNHHQTPQPPPKPPRLLPKLLQCALRAGKGARNVDQVPQLLQLRQYGTGDTSYYDSTPPAQVIETVQQAVLQQVIDPLVQDYVQNVQCILHSTTTSSSSIQHITTLHQTALALSNSASETKWIKQQLHAPTVALRRLQRTTSNGGGGGDNGDDIISQTIASIQEGLLLQRQAAATAATVTATSSTN
jgi:hypothetical protein